MTLWARYFIVALTFTAAVVTSLGTLALFAWRVGEGHYIQAAAVLLLVLPAVVATWARTLPWFAEWGERG